jgi:hypothetical protein
MLRRYTIVCVRVMLGAKAGDTLLHAMLLDDDARWSTSWAAGEATKRVASGWNQSCRPPIERCRR